MGIALMTAPALAQDQFLHNDRDNDAIYRTFDFDHSSVIEDDEIFLFFSGANVEGTPGPMNPNTIAASVCRVVAVGDQANRNVVVLRDLNGDGDAQDDDESIVFADATNLSGISFAFPTGAAFDNECRLCITNAGNSFGNDGIYRLVDLNGDGDAQDENEITQYVGDAPGGFGPGNGAYSPQEIFFDTASPGNVGYLRNSSQNLHGVYRFQDINNNGRADDSDVDPDGTDEFTPYFTSANASMIPTAAGFAIEPDRFRPGSIYFLQTITGPIRQLIRLTDLNFDRDAQDRNEAAIVWSGAEPNAIDVISLLNGDVLLIETSSGFVHRLHDGNNDGDFNDAGLDTITLVLPNGAGTLLDVRQATPLCREADTNCSGTIDVDDLIAVILSWGAATCTGADTNCSGAVDVDDLIAVILNWG